MEIDRKSLDTPPFCGREMLFNAQFRDEFATASVFIWPLHQNGARLFIDEATRLGGRRKIELCRENEYLIGFCLV